VSPLFSIVIPSFNQAQWLDACLKSVLDQEGVRLEVIVMDGGSTDGSLEIIQRYAPRLAYWQSQKDGGQAAAIRAGFERAQGGILAWLNSDDLYLPGALAAVAGFFETHPDEEAVNGGGYYIDAGGQPYRWRRLNQNHSLGVRADHGRFRYFHPQQGILQAASFWRREAYLAVGGVDPQFQYIMDFDLFTRLTQRRPLARLPKLLACFRIHADNKTHAMKAVYHRELKVWAAKYGVDRESRLWRALMFLRYLGPFALGKIEALWRERFGALAPTLKRKIP
jgi:glycosyltransferase involved in cell wall biosynthesis